MFYLPGRVQGLLVFKLAAIALVLVGYRHVLLATAQARFYAGCRAALGVASFLIHAGFALAGRGQPLAAVDGNYRTVPGGERVAIE